VGRKDGNRGKESESLLKKKIGYKFFKGPGKFKGIGCKVILYSMTKKWKNALQTVYSGGNEPMFRLTQYCTYTVKEHVKKPFLI
jgi:hypothetical protein